MNETATLLDALRDVHGLPGAPPATGVAGLSLVLVVVGMLVCTLALVILSRRRPPWRREAEATLASIQAELRSREPATSLAATSRLVRQLALVGAERETVAALTGTRWLARLDALLGGACFTRGPGRLLAEAPYRRDVVVAHEELAAILACVERLIDAIAVRRRRDRGRRVLDRLQARLHVGRSRATRA